MFAEGKPLAEVTRQEISDLYASRHSSKLVAKSCLIKLPGYRWNRWKVAPDVLLYITVQNNAGKTLAPAPVEAEVVNPGTKLGCFQEHIWQPAE